MTEGSVKIIQIAVTPNEPLWRGSLLGLGSDGVTYIADGGGVWEPLIDALKGDGK